MDGANGEKQGEPSSSEGLSSSGREEAGFEYYELHVRVIVGGSAALFGGIGLIAFGEIVVGLGTLLAAAIAFGLLIWARVSKRKASGVSALPILNSRSGLFWVGFFLSMLPVPVFFYLRYTMVRNASGAFIFVSVPMLVAGFGLMASAFWMKGSNMEDE